VLEFRSGKNNFFAEFMESPRISEGAITGVYRFYLERKYREIPFDFIIAWAPRATDFLAADKNLFPGAQRIFVEDAAGKDRGKGNGETDAMRIGIQEDFRATMDEIIRIASPKHIYVIGTSGDSTALTRRKRFEDSLSGLPGAPEVHFIDESSLEAIASRLENIPRGDSVAVYLLMFSDGGGRSLTPYEAAGMLARRSAIPVFSYWESLMGSGIVGGCLISQEKIGMHIGGIILSREKHSDASYFSPMRYVYDCRALEKWGISEDRLPAGAIVMNHEPHIWQRYRWHIFAILSAITGLSLFSLSLIRALRLKNRAVMELDQERANLEKTVEERTGEISRSNMELAASEERYRNLSDASFEGIYISYEGRIIEANSTMTRMFGYSTQELTRMTPRDLVTPEDRDRVRINMESDYEMPYELTALARDGTRFPVEVKARYFEYGGKRVRVAAIRDLTAQKKAEAEVSSLKEILPICSHCKKIRNDEGSWTQMEEYVRDHYDATFSHGLCQDCARRLYPQYFDEAGRAGK
jgi:PAS domain S-box-containing protein